VAGRPQIVFVIEVNEGEEDKVPTDLLNYLRDRVSHIPSADVSWHTDEGEPED